MFDVIGQGVEQQFFADGHLSFVFGTNQDLHGGLPSDADDGGAELDVVVFFELVVTGLFDRIWLGFFFRDEPVGGKAEAGDAAEELARLEVVLLEEGLGCGVIAEVGSEGAIWAEGHDGTGAAELFGESERVGIAKENKLRTAEDGEGVLDGFSWCRLGGSGALGRESDAIDAVGFAGFLCPAFYVFLGDEGRARAMEEEVAFLEGGFEGSRVLDDGHLREALAKHIFDAVIDFAGPEADFDIGQMFFEQGEHAWGVRDIADVDGLPGRTEEEAFRAFRRVKLRGNGSSEGGGDEMAAVYARASTKIGWGASWLRPKAALC